MSYLCFFKPFFRKIGLKMVFNAEYRIYPIPFLKVYTAFAVPMKCEDCVSLAIAASEEFWMISRACLDFGIKYLCPRWHCGVLLLHLCTCALLHLCKIPIRFCKTQPIFSSQRSHLRALFRDGYRIFVRFVFFYEKFVFCILTES